MSNEFKNIAIERDESKVKIILNRPPLNILNIEMLEEINIALNRFCDDSNLRAVIIAAHGKAFSAGVDIKDHTEEKVDKMIKVFHEMFKNLSLTKAPTIALVNGVALGGGCELALFCDLVVASEKAEFGQPEIKVGVFPPIAAIIFPKLTGIKKTLELILTGETITANEAKELGLINIVLPAENFDALADEFIKKIITNSAVVLHLAKRSIYDTAGLSYDNAIKKIEDLYLNKLMKTEDAKEGLRAFLEKRKPVWKNK
ncbi:MAG: enoyl-CoA hydratase/isomerase family protein [Candidatus Thermoplasmatota archaeon]|nr:enoyl-CoA hydratase/isomerase family protein [Candidatus Thermoplasmatota archaeon]